MKETSTVQFRENISDYLNYAAYGNEPVLITRRHKPLAVIISLDMYEKLQKE